MHPETSEGELDEMGGGWEVECYTRSLPVLPAPRLAAAAAPADRAGAVEEPQDSHELLRAKWLLDGASTLEEAAQRLRAEAVRLERLHADGYTLAEVIEEDRGWIRPPRR